MYLRLIPFTTGKGLPLLFLKNRENLIVNFSNQPRICPDSGCDIQQTVLISLHQAYRAATDGSAAFADSDKEAGAAMLVVTYDVMVDEKCTRILYTVDGNIKESETEERGGYNAQCQSQRDSFRTKRYEYIPGLHTRLYLL